MLTRNVNSSVSDYLHFIIVTNMLLISVGVDKKIIELY